MVILDYYQTLLKLPKINRCKLAHDNMYQLILQNLATKDVTIFKLFDSVGTNPLYYIFKFEVPDWLYSGDYKLLLVSNNEWLPNEIDTNIPEETYCKIDKGGITNNDKFIVINGKVLVTRWFKAQLFNDGCPMTINYQDLGGNVLSDDKSYCGNIVTELDLIHTDLLRIKGKDIKYNQPIQTGRKTYKEYKRNGS